MIHSADITTQRLDVRTARPPARSGGRDFSRSLADTGEPSARAESVRSPQAEAERPSGAAPAAPSNGFVRRSDSFAQGHVPRFEFVPEAAQWPHGPYKQAPPEYGGEWWLVNPFSGPEPWVRASEIAAQVEAVEPEQPSEDFVKLFGPRSERNEFSSRSEFKLRTFVWERDLENFEGVGIPDGFTEEEVRKAADDMKQWGLGEPVFYKSRGVWSTRFPDSELPKFSINPDTAIKAPQVTAAVYQVQAILRGVDVSSRHPLVPSDVWPLDRYTVNA